MDSERYHISRETADLIAQTRASGGRVVAVGTTVVRTLESAAVAAVQGQNSDPRVRSGSASTELFISPGYRFRVVDALMTNFHLPRSTLLMLVTAFAGYDPVMAAYREAVTRDYRFYSYGDAMVLVP